MRRIAAGLAVLLCTACAPAIQRTRLPADWHPSPNHNERRPQFVILHHTGSATLERALRTLTSPDREVSAHYVIDRDGRIVQLVDERQRAWHAGDASWGSVHDLNSASIGIELVNTGDEPFPDAQIASLIALLQDLRDRLKIPATNILGHGDIAPGRKVDPSVHFPWARLAAAGLGLWCDPSRVPDRPAPPQDDPGVEARLSALGYETANLAAAIRAFRRHHMGREHPEDALYPDESAQLDCLLEARRWLDA